MKKALLSLSLLLLVLPIAGCPSASSNTPQTALAPGYTSAADQTLGQSLAALNAFVKSEKENYECSPAAKTAETCLSPAQKLSEKTALNAMIDSVTVANAAYTGYHQGTQTLNQAQASINSAQNAQASLASAKGVK